MKGCSCYCVVLAMLAGCGSRSAPASARNDSAAGRDSVAAVAAATMDENAVFGLLDEVNASDSALGALGASRATTTDVRDFGRMITREHHALRKDGIALAQRLGVVPTQPRVPPDAPPESMQQALLQASGKDSTSGASWDRNYIDYAVAAHRAALENAARALAATQHAETKEYIGIVVPILQKHLDKATALAKALAARARPSRPPRSR